MRLLDLPAWLDAWDLPYTLDPGWRSRGRPFDAPPLVVMGHHTATPLTPANRHLDLPTLRVLREGRPDLDGPLCQVGLGRTGLVTVVASGKANHAGSGRWLGLPGGRDYDVAVSSRTVGIEAEHPGTVDAPWPVVQMDAYDRLAACLLWGLEQDAEAYCGHREWALPEGRKPDPVRIHLPRQRARIAVLLRQGPPSRTQPVVHDHRKDTDMLDPIVYADDKATCLWERNALLPLATGEVDALVAVGHEKRPLTPPQFEALERLSARSLARQEALGS